MDADDRELTMTASALRGAIVHYLTEADGAGTGISRCIVEAISSVVGEMGPGDPHARHLVDRVPSPWDAQSVAELLDDLARDAATEAVRIWPDLEQ